MPRGEEGAFFMGRRVAYGKMLERSGVGVEVWAEIWYNMRHL